MGRNFVKSLSTVKQKWRNYKLERGVVIDRARGYVYVRYFRQDIVRKELIGRTTDADVFEKANGAWRFRTKQIDVDLNLSCRSATHNKVGRIVRTAVFFAPNCRRA